LGLSVQFRHRPQSSLVQAVQRPHETVRFRFFCAHQSAPCVLVLGCVLAMETPASPLSRPASTASGVISIVAVIYRRSQPSVLL